MVGRRTPYISFSQEKCECNKSWKYRPYRQSVAYHFRLLTDSKVQPVFHVSLHERVIRAQVVESNFPEDLSSKDSPHLPEVIIGRRTVDHEGWREPQLLIKWNGLAEDERLGWMRTMSEVNFFSSALRTKLLLRDNELIHNHYWFIEEVPRRWWITTALKSWR